ncbi:hypothetical protein GCM10010402_01720 [Actinomadura luteofluorescens]|uniref:type II toxin-antitoxin system HicA family toxin n=1 Tax=Actinomadura luteofluorescens TaxID=46163 RepID=UPI0021643D13|nr:type II toxin-antitoxin system HicA family toxin [Actinomadura glauciflava]MCR3744112.1 putative RNA binding protein YcfA, dsRBD-like fold, HicA-like mRNA interferase family [Actinomadura glauciflava]
MLRVLQKLGYEIVRQRGSHRRLECEGRPPITFAFHDRRSLTPTEVRDILVKQAELSCEEAVEVVQGG